MAAEPGRYRPEQVRVLICSYRSRADISDAIRSCLEQGMAPAQVTVVDNASGDGTVEVVGQGFPEVRLLPQPRNLGFAAATNLAAGEAGGAVLLLLNPDSQLAPGALAEMLEALAQDPRRGAVSPRIERPDGRMDLACRRSFPDPLVAFWRLSGLSRLRPGSASLGRYNLTNVPFDRPMEIDSGSGACLLIPREVWDRLQGFDQSFFMYGEDLDLCWRIRDLGRVVWYQPTALVVHRKGQSSRQVALPMLVAFHRSMWRFYRLHYLKGPNALWAPLVGIGILARLSVLLVLNRVRRDPVVSP